ncbi:hypothetical protein [Conexibacter sp. CPCC 206217]|uniref:hypothetical protein n=1 Tax=Conexibacter sp. CPCC 206217 TaxID=3064574 RepID=UPI002718A93A|nr:hypothetical protein [Conexibacter sp. CPCC 206217]MDO8213309.1 hypothetical protein [Conexibacter sp. CPCC 206217]
MTPLPPADAARMLAALSRYHRMVVAEYEKRPPLWPLLLDMASVFAFHASRDLDDGPRSRTIRTAAAVSETVVRLLRSNREAPRVELDAPSPTAPAARRGLTVAASITLIASALLPKRLLRQLQQRGIAYPNTVTGAVVALTVLPLGRIVLDRRERHDEVRRVLPDVSFADAFGPDPEPALEPLFAAPDQLALAALLAPARNVNRSFVRDATHWEDAALSARILRLESAGFATTASEGWPRRVQQLSLTSRGRSALAAHAAALRVAAAA